MSSSVIQTMVEIKSFTIFLLTFVAAAKSFKYEPTWASLDSRPLPQWYDDAKVGIFIHWGVYSVPSIESEWFWLKWKDRNDSIIVDYMEKYYPKGFTYQEFAKDFTAEFFDPVQWADLFTKAGAKYVVLTSKHHEGYTLWPSPYSFSWNSLEVGPHRDLVGELASAIRETSTLHFGLYHSLLEWYNPLYIADKQKNFSGGNFYYTHKVKPELTEMILRYKPEIVWSDGDWYCTPEYWESKEFLAWLYNESPVKDTVVVNDRWGNDTYGKHGDFYNFADRYNPGVLLKHKWENAMSIDKESWGYRRDAELSDYLPITDLIQTLVKTISCGGNILINVGPTKDGIIAPIFEERLLQLGNWLQINGEAIYSSRPWQIQNDTVGNVWYTQKDKAVYAITLRWPTNNLLILKSANNLFENGTTKVHFLENGQKLEWFKTRDGIAVKLPELQTIKGRFAWTIKI